MYSILQIYYNFYKTPFLTFRIGSKYTFVVTLNDSGLFISWSFEEFLMVLKSFEEFLIILIIQFRSFKVIIHKSFK